MKTEKLIAPGVLMICLLVLAPLCAFAELPEGMPETVGYFVFTNMNDTKFRKAGDTSISYPDLLITPVQLSAICAARGFEVLLPTDETLPGGVSVGSSCAGIYTSLLPDSFPTPKGEADYTYDYTYENSTIHAERWDIPTTVLTENFSRVKYRLQGDEDNRLYAFQVFLGVPAPEENSLEILENGLIVTKRENLESSSIIEAIQHAKDADGKTLMYIKYICRTGSPTTPLDLLTQILEAACPVD